MGPPLALDVSSSEESTSHSNEPLDNCASDTMMCNPAHHKGVPRDQDHDATEHPPPYRLEFADKSLNKVSILPRSGPSAGLSGLFGDGVAVRRRWACDRVFVSVICTEQAPQAPGGSHGSWKRMTTPGDTPCWWPFAGGPAPSASARRLPAHVLAGSGIRDKLELDSGSTMRPPHLFAKGRAPGKRARTLRPRGGRPDRLGWPPRPIVRRIVRGRLKAGLVARELRGSLAADGACLVRRRARKACEPGGAKGRQNWHDIRKGDNAVLERTTTTTPTRPETSSATPALASAEVRATP